MTDLQHELAAARRREAATREILRVISRSPGDYAPVFQTILDNAIRLCGAPFGMLFLLRDGHLHVAADAGSRPEFLQYLRDSPQPVDIPHAVLSRAAREREPIQRLDMADEIYRSGEARRAASVDIGGVRTLLGVPMLKGDETLGVIALYRQEVKKFDDDDIELVRTFADQAVIALENVRSFQEIQSRTAALTQSLERQTATSEILRVISRSPTDYAPVFQTILDNAIRLCRAPFGTLFMLRGAYLHVVADAGSQPEMVEHLRAHPIALDESSAVTSLSVRERAPRQRADLKDEAYRSGDPRRIAAVDRFGVRTWLSVPILKGDDVVGTIALYRKEVKPFNDDEIGLVSTFADQAIIAIENVRQFQAVQSRTAALTQALERQTATSEILRAISRSPGDYQPTFETILANAARLCEAPLGTLFLLHDGALEAVESLGARPEMMAFLRDNRFPVDRDTAIGHAVLERIPVQIEDIAALGGTHTRNSLRVASVELEGIRTILAVPMIKSDKVAGVIILYRRQVARFGDDLVKLVQGFADQAVIALENVRLFQALQARTAALTQSLERQTATSEILRSISQSPTDYQPVFDTILENAVRLCRAPFGMLFLERDGYLHLEADRNGLPQHVEFMQANPIPIESGKGVTSIAARDRVPTQHADIADDAYLAGNKFRVVNVDVAGIRTMLGVPMVKGDEIVGVITLYRRQVDPFSEDQIGLVSTFADQAVIAIENVRLFQALQGRTAALTQSLERQTAASEILRSISRSPTDYAPVFDTILENATRLCGAPFGTLLLVRDDHLHMVANLGGRPEFIDYLERTPLPLDRPATASTAARERVPVHSLDIADETYRAGDPIRVFSVDVGGLRTLLAVPMLKGDEAVGVIALYRHEVKAFEENDIELVSTFADQAVIAIENVRLFQALQGRTAALTQSLERQTATSEILRSISRSPTDYQPVFATILENATRLCEASLGTLFLFQNGHLELVKSMGGRPAFIEYIAEHPVQVDDRTAVGHAALSRTAVQIEDARAMMHADEGTSSPARVAAVELEGARTFLAVPMLRDDQLVGIVAIYRREVRPFDDQLVGLLETFADQAVIAIENVRLFQALESRSAELERSVTELEALGEVAQAVSSTLDVDTVLNTIVDRAVQLSGAHAGAINEFDEATGTLPPRAAPGLEELIELPAPRLGEGAVGRAAATRAPVQIPDIATPGAYTGHLMDALASLRIRALLAVPMVQADRVVGTLVVGRRTPGEFPPETVRVLQALGTQSAIAIRNARLFAEIEEKSRELEAANRHKSEFLANMSHELRTPLNAVIGFSEVLGERMFGELNDKQAEYVKDIHDSGRHLLSLINDILDLSKIEAGAMELDVSRFALEPALDNAVTLVKERAGRRGIALQAKLDEELGEIEGDERKLKQILLNLLSNAIKFTGEGGTVTLEAKRDGTTANIAVRDTGVGISEEDQGVIFDEFRQVGTDYARKVEGTGLGLTLTKRFVELHGGSISVESEPGVGSVFTVSLPLSPTAPATQGMTQ